MPDNGLYDDAADSYDGDGTTSYDYPYLAYPFAYDAVTPYPRWEVTTDLPVYRASTTYPTYSATTEYPLEP